MRTRLMQALRNACDRAGWISVHGGVPPAWLGYRWVPVESVSQYFARHGGAPRAGRYETVHPAAAADNPLPCNIAAREDLPGDRGWWGFSFRDVPARTSGETFIATLPACRVVWYREPARGNDFYPAIVTADGRGLDVRELRFRPRHAEVLRRSPAPARRRTATWIVERVYHNHSHWLTAHLPKLLLLRDRGGLEDVLLPRERTPAIDGSLRAVGLDPSAFDTFDPARPLLVDELTVVGTDRFRPELLRLAARASHASGSPAPWRRVFVSRSLASRRRLADEDAIWRLFERDGFERVHMEALGFDQQVSLMRETAILAAPHGAGLTNMLFCQPGVHVIEIADLTFPNPNFYALASALGHHYWLAGGEGVGEGHPLDRDLRVEADTVRDVLERVRERTGAPCGRFAS